MKKLIKQIQAVKTECKKRNRLLKEVNFNFETLCKECKYHKECIALYDLSEILYELVPKDYDIETIIDSLKVLGYEDD